MKPINRIKEILSQRGIENLTPKIDQLARLKTTIKTWNKWVRKSSDPEMWQIPIICDMLDVSLDELFSYDKVAA